MINDVPRVNELNQMIDEDGNVILNGFGQPVYFYPQTGQAYYNRPEPGTPEADPYIYKKKHGVYPDGSTSMAGNYATPNAQAAGAKGMAIASLVLGITSVLFGLLLYFVSAHGIMGILAIIFGARVKHVNKMGLAGMILGIVGFVLGILNPIIRALFFSALW